MKNRCSFHFMAMSVMHVFATLVCLLWSGVLVIGAVDTHYVSLDGTNDSVNGYITWSGAATQIQWAVDASAASDTVLVSNGTYNLTNQIRITKAVTVRSFTEQSHGTNDTIVNGNYPACTNRCFYMEQGVLDGFTVSNGCSTTAGGGIYFYGTASVVNCFIYKNYCSNNSGAWPSGGGIYSDGTGPGSAGGAISNCAIISNICYSTSIGVGGGVAMASSYFPSTIVASHISGNEAYQSAGIYIGSLAGWASNCLIDGNRAARYSGGMQIKDNKPGHGAVNCVISNNFSSQDACGVELVGGAIANSIIIGNQGAGVSLSYTAVMTNCQAIGNISTNGAGGIVAGAQYGNSRIENCVIANNISTGAAAVQLTGVSPYGVLMRNSLIYCNTNLSGDKGGVYIDSISNYPYGLINCTIANNQSATRGGGIYAKGANNYIENCIVYFNVTTNDAYDEIYNDTAANTNNYWHTCTPTNLVLNQGNITANPLFVDQASRNYRLSANSSCINAGTNQAWMPNSYDLDGRTRIRYGIVDMGAYELIHSGTIYGFH